MTYLKLAVLIALLVPASLVLAVPGGIVPGFSTNEFEFLDLDNDSVPDQINWDTTNGAAVVVDDTLLTGDIWGESVGWLRLNPVGGGVTNDGNGNLSGYAWGHNAGWVSFDCANGSNCASNANFQVTISPTTGDFSGYAWSENYGWINFSCPGANTCVRTDWTTVVPTPPGGNSSSGGLMDCADHVDNDGDGLVDWPVDPGCGAMTDNDEYDFVPTVCSDGLDNDGDGKKDYPNDPGCWSAADKNEVDNYVPPAPPEVAPGETPGGEVYPNEAEEDLPIMFMPATLNHRLAKPLDLDGDGFISQAELATRPLTWFEKLFMNIAGYYRSVDVVASGDCQTVISLNLPKKVYDGVKTIHEGSHVVVCVSEFLIFTKIGNVIYAILSIMLVGALAFGGFLPIMALTALLSIPLFILVPNWFGLIAAIIHPAVLIVAIGWKLKRHK